MSIQAAFAGILGKDAESKTSAKGKQYLRLSVRVGEGDRAQWINLTTFDDRAIAEADKFVKGAVVYAEGRLTLDKWTTQEGAERHGLSVLSWHTRLAQIGRNKQRRTRHAGGERTEARPLVLEGQGPAELNDDIPF